MADSQPPPPPPSPPKRKKPAFKRPTFKPPASRTDPADDRDFFSHTREIFKPSAFVTSASTTSNARSPTKRSASPTIPLDNSDSGDEVAPSLMRARAAATHARFKEESKNKSSRRSASVPQSPVKSRKLTRERKPSITPPPQLPSPPQQSSRPPPPPPPIQLSSPFPAPPEADGDVFIVSDSVPPEDDYFAALERRARERSVSTQLPSSSPAADPVIKIFVTSLIPNTRPLILKLKYRQKLRLLRNGWCRHHGMPPDDVYFLWKGAKVFDSMSCADIGVKVDVSTGEVEWPQEGVGIGEGVEEDRDNKVHFEAVTEEIMQMKRRREEMQEDEEDELPQQDEPSINLKLKAQSMDTVGLKVRPTTTIEQLMSAFRSERNIPFSKELSFRFDGDELVSDQMVEDAGLEDMDSIDVRIS